MVRSLRPNLIFATCLILGFALFAYLARAYGPQALAILALNPSGPFAASFVLSAVATVLLLSWRWGFVMGGRRSPIRLWRLALFRSAAHTLAVLVPSGKLGGDPLRAWLATRSKVSAGRAIAGVAVDRTLEIGSSVPFSVFFAVLLLQHGVPQLAHALVSVLIGSLAFGIGVVMVVRRLRKGRGLVSSLLRNTRLSRLSVIGSSIPVAEDAESAVVELVARRRRMAIAFGVGLVANLLVILEFILLLKAFGLPSDTIAIVAAIFATGAAHMLPVPGGVGVLEGAQIWIFHTLGYPAEVGLAVGLAVRARELLWMAPGVAVLFLDPLGSPLRRLRKD